MRSSPPCSEKIQGVTGNGSNGDLQAGAYQAPEQRLFAVRGAVQAEANAGAAILSATGEKNPGLAWNLNMQGLLNVLEIAKEESLSKVYWPSSIAVFGPTSPKTNCPQQTIIEPVTVYGISKYAGEIWCNYYYNRFGVDVRSIRYPGLISYKSGPGGGTTQRFKVEGGFLQVVDNAVTVLSERAEIVA